MNCFEEKEDFKVWPIEKMGEWAKFVFTGAEAVAGLKIHTRCVWLGVLDKEIYQL